MNLPSWSIVTSLVCAILHGALAFALYKQSLARTWRFLAAACALQASTSPILLMVHSHYKWYFYLYWSREAVLAVLHMLIMSDIASATPGLPRALSESRRPLISFIALLSGGAIFLTVLDHPLRIAPIALLLNRCSNLLWATALVITAVFVVISGFGLPRLAHRIATGYLLMVATGLTTSYLFSIRNLRVIYAATFAEAIVTCGVLAYWLHSVVQPTTLVRTELPFDQLLPTISQERQGWS